MITPKCSFRQHGDAKNIKPTPKTGMKRKRISKNKKKSWKHSDVNDVEAHLDDVRLEERIGGAVSEKPNDVLFFVDTSQIDDKKPSKSAAKEVAVKFRCYRHLEPAPFPEPCIKPSVKKPPSKEKELVIKKRLTIKQAKRKAKLREPPKVALKPKREWAPDYDIWDKDGEHPMESYQKDIVEFHESQTKNKKTMVPKMRYHKPSALAAVEIPHPGASYNPSYEEYQDLVTKANSIEEQKKKQEEHLDRVLTKMFPSKAEAPTQATWLSEMTQGLQIEGVPESESSDDDDDENDSEMLPNPTVRAERKLSSKRRREERQKLMDKELQKNKNLRKQQNEIYRLKTIRKEIKESDSLTESNIQERKKKEELKRFQPAILSRYKYEAPDLEVCTTSELTGSLRLLNSQGCLSEDRLKSLQRRNIIEPRIIQLKKRKYKLKTFFKKGHKMEELDYDNKQRKRNLSQKKSVTLKNEKPKVRNQKSVTKRASQAKKLSRKTHQPNKRGVK